MRKWTQHHEEMEEQTTPRGLKIDTAAATGDLTQNWILVVSKIHHKMVAQIHRRHATTDEAALQQRNHVMKNGTAHLIAASLTPALRSFGERVDLDQGAVPLDEHRVHVLQEGLTLRFWFEQKQGSGHGGWT